MISFRLQEPVYRFYSCKSTRESPVFGTRGYDEVKKEHHVLFDVRDPPLEKNLKQNAEYVWRLCLITLLLHPHSRENAATK